MSMQRNARVRPRDSGLSAQRKPSKLARNPKAGGAKDKLEKIDWDVIGRSHEGARVIYMRLMTSSVLREQVQLFAGTESPLNDAAATFFADLVERMKPRDGVEEMLVAQMAWTHFRLSYLSMISTKQQSIRWAAHVHEAADAASNTFRRQMLALAEYRRPPRPAFTAIAQANIAQQQVVQNRNLENQKVTNEQGSDHGQKDLPADAVGTGVASGVSTPPAAVAAQYRAADARGKGASADERVASRGAVARRQGGAQGDDGVDANPPA